MSYGGDSMEVDDNKGQPWDLFFSKLSPKSLQDSPVVCFTLALFLSSLPFFHCTALLIGHL